MRIKTVRTRRKDVSKRQHKGALKGSVRTERHKLKRQLSSIAAGRAA